MNAANGEPPPRLTPLNSCSAEARSFRDHWKLVAVRREEWRYGCPVGGRAGGYACEKHVGERDEPRYSTSLDSNVVEPRLYNNISRASDTDTFPFSKARQRSVSRGSASHTLSVRTTPHADNLLMPSSPPPAHRRPRRHHRRQGGAMGHGSGADNFTKDHV